MRDKSNLDRERLSVLELAETDHVKRHVLSLLSLLSFPCSFLFHLHPKLSPSRLNPSDSCQGSARFAAPQLRQKPVFCKPQHGQVRRWSSFSETNTHMETVSLFYATSVRPETKDLPEVSRNSVRVYRARHRVQQRYYKYLLHALLHQLSLRDPMHVSGLVELTSPAKGSETARLYQVCQDGRATSRPLF